MLRGRLALVDGQGTPNTQRTAFEMSLPLITHGKSGEYQQPIDKLYYLLKSCLYGLLRVRVLMYVLIM
jgi:hypothetical protein